MLNAISLANFVCQRAAADDQDVYGRRLRGEPRAEPRRPLRPIQQAAAELDDATQRRSLVPWQSLLALACAAGSETLDSCLSVP